VAEPQTQLFCDILYPNLQTFGPDEYTGSITLPDTESEDDEEAAELPGTPGKGQVSAVSAEDERLIDELSRRR